MYVSSRLSYCEKRMKKIDRRDTHIRFFLEKSIWQLYVDSIKLKQIDWNRLYNSNAVAVVAAAAAAAATVRVNGEKKIVMCNFEDWLSYDCHTIMKYGTVLLLLLLRLLLTLLPISLLLFSSFTYQILWSKTKCIFPIHSKKENNKKKIWKQLNWAKQNEIHESCRSYSLYTRCWH